MLVPSRVHDALPLQHGRHMCKAGVRLPRQLAWQGDPSRRPFWVQPACTGIRVSLWEGQRVPGKAVVSCSQSAICES